MAFVTLPFVFFVAVVILAYFLCPMRYQWLVLLIASYVYFWINSEWLVVVLFASTVVTYGIARAIFYVNSKSKQYLKEHSEELTAQSRKAYKAKTKEKTKWILALGVCLNLSVLLVLKYFNFFADLSNSVLQYLGLTIPRIDFLLPIGISFYTLQAIAYMTDVYRNKYTPDRNLGKFMLFMSYFPQIVQGPIARHQQLAHQLYEGHTFDYQRAMYGAQLILWGFIKKLVIADRVAIPVAELFDHYTRYQGLAFLMAAVLYSIQVYADFSGGMDIARGISQILGIELELNFKQPYCSKSIEEFWRRWHITLGSWMREYVFYPLSLSKTFAKLGKSARNVFGPFIGKRLPAFLAMFIVYFLVGFWHGPNWTYIAYGVWNGVFIVAGILLTDVYDKTRAKCGIKADSFPWRMFQIFRTFALVSVGRLFSRAETLTAAMYMGRSMVFQCLDLSFLSRRTLINLGLNSRSWLLLLVAVIGMLFVDYLHEKGISIRTAISKQHIIVRWAIYYAAILFLLVFGIYGPNYNAASFIYEQF